MTDPTHGVVPVMGKILGSKGLLSSSAPSLGRPQGAGYDSIRVTTTTKGEEIAMLITIEYCVV
jgi:hypothetical protein